MSALAIKCEQAWVSYIQSMGILDSAQVYPGTNTATKTLPCIVVEVQGTGEEDPPLTGNYWMHSEIRMEHTAVPNETGTTPGDDVKLDFQGMLEVLMAGVQIDDLKETLSPLVPDFTVIGGPIYEAPTAVTDSNGLWKHSINVRLLCFDRDI